MEAAVPGEVIDPGRGFEENDRGAGRRGGLSSHALCDTRDLEVVQPADEPALDALFVELSKSIHVR
jgi:hypothetical protein